MPLPPYLISANVMVCERILHEADGVISAIRLVDLFTVSEPGPDAPAGVVPGVQAYALVMFKATPEHTAEHSLEIKLLNTAGELVSLGDPANVTFSTLPELEGKVPKGMTINIQLNLAVKRYGTCYICVSLDGEEVARTPFTLQQKRVEAKG